MSRMTPTAPDATANLPVCAPAIHVARLTAWTTAQEQSVARRSMTRGYHGGPEQ